MTRRKRNPEAHSNKKNFTIHQVKRKLPINKDYLLNIEPLTENQRKLFEFYEEGKNIIAYGAAGSGKSFLCIYNALKEVFDVVTPYEKIYIMRSIVSTRDPGFLPGSLDDKVGVYETPYKKMIKYMFELPSDADFDMLYDNLKRQNTIEFLTTSFLRGDTLDNCIIIVDEFENCNGHELDSIITRAGDNCKIMFCGDATQSDLTKISERDGLHDFMTIIKAMPSFEVIEFGIDDIVRSSLVKEYLVAKYTLNITL